MTSLNTQDDVAILRRIEILFPRDLEYYLESNDTDCISTIESFIGNQIDSIIPGAVSVQLKRN